MAQQKVEIKIEDRAGFRVVRPTADLDVYTVRGLRDSLAQSIEERSPPGRVHPDAVRF